MSHRSRSRGEGCGFPPGTRHSAPLGMQSSGPDAERASSTGPGLRAAEQREQRAQVVLRGIQDVVESQERVPLLFRICAFRFLSKTDSP